MDPPWGFGPRGFAPVGSPEAWPHPSLRPGTVVASRPRERASFGARAETATFGRPLNVNT
eukprot:11109035-Alexandrium_andersonii.AAC.1